MNFKEIQVVKIGSQALFRDEKKLDFNRIDDLCISLRNLRDKHRIMSIVVTSGAVSLGKQLVNLENVKDGILRDQMYACVGQPELMRLYAMTLGEEVAQLLPTHSILNNRDHHQKIGKMLLSLINVGTFPIINYNDSVDDAEMTQVSSYTDNDKVAEEIAAIIKAKRLILLTTVDGIFDKKGEIIETVDGEYTFKDIKKVCAGKNNKGTGGMISKVITAEKLKDKGIETIVANAKYPLEFLLEGKDQKGHKIPRTVFK